MNTSLPTAADLEKLPVRAVVAYAARTARRLSSTLQDVVANDIIENALRLIENVATTNLICEVDQVSIITAAQRVVESYEGAPSGVKSLGRFRIIFSIIQAALADMNAIESAVNPGQAQYKMKRAASAAEKAIRPIDALDPIAAIAAKEAARQDYEILLATYGEHDEVIIGEPVDCFKGKE